MLKFFRSLIGGSKDKTQTPPEIQRPVVEVGPDLGDNLATAIRGAQISLNTQYNKITGKVTCSIQNDNFEKFPRSVQDLLNQYSSTNSSGIRKFEVPIGSKDDCDRLINFFKEGITPPEQTRSWEHWKRTEGQDFPKAIVNTEYRTPANLNPENRKLLSVISETLGCKPEDITISQDIPSSFNIRKIQGHEIENPKKVANKLRDKGIVAESDVLGRITIDVNKSMENLNKPTKTRKPTP